VRLNAKRFGVDPQRLGVTGASSGGHLSLMLGAAGDDGDPKAADEVLRTSDRVAAVVAYCPPTDIRPWTKPSSSYYKNYPALQFDTAKAGDYSPRLLASRDDAATLLIHGDADTLVPLEHSQAMLAELKRNGVDAELLVLKGASHGFKGDQARQAADARVAWFVKKLAPGKGGKSCQATR
jgi:dipeptidyl aminopeptidase/acylaminoacyl peptidase